MSDDVEDGREPGVGYGRPPKRTQFQKLQSGNPGGRPRNRRREIPYDTILGQMVTIREDGKERRVTAAEAFLLHLTRKGLEGDQVAARASLQAIETARERAVPQLASDTFKMTIVTFGASTALGNLGIGTKLYARDKDRVRWALNTWVVEAALARLGDRRLTVDEQQEVVAAVPHPAEVHWPEWWTVRPWAQ